MGATVAMGRSIEFQLWASILFDAALDYITDAVLVRLVSNELIETSWKNNPYSSHTASAKSTSIFLSLAGENASFSLEMRVLCLIFLLCFFV